MKHYEKIFNRPLLTVQFSKNKISTENSIIIKYRLKNIEININKNIYDYIYSIIKE